MLFTNVMFVLGSSELCTRQHHSRQQFTAAGHHILHAGPHTQHSHHDTAQHAAYCALPVINNGVPSRPKEVTQMRVHECNVSMVCKGRGFLENKT